jgi:hypothetical protein
MSVSNLLDRLDRVKQTGPRRWLACCPAHEDRRPSLSIRALDDGRVLIHCFAGCGAADVLGSLGIEMRDLFPERLPGSGPAGGFSSSHSKIPATDLIVILSHEITVAVLILSDVVQLRTVDEGQLQRLCAAAARIGKARDMSSPEGHRAA